MATLGTLDALEPQKPEQESVWDKLDFRRDFEEYETLKSYPETQSEAQMLEVLMIDRYQIMASMPYFDYSDDLTEEEEIEAMRYPKFRNTDEIANTYDGLISMPYSLEEEEDLDEETKESIADLNSQVVLDYSYMMLLLALRSHKEHINDNLVKQTLAEVSHMLSPDQLCNLISQFSDAKTHIIPHCEEMQNKFGSVVSHFKNT